MPLIQKKNSIIVINSKYEEINQALNIDNNNNSLISKNSSSTSISNLTQKLNSKLNLNDKKFFRPINNNVRHSLILPRSFTRLKQSETFNSIDKLETKEPTGLSKIETTKIQQTASLSSKQQSTDNQSSPKKPNRIIIPWSITNWLNSQKKKTNKKSTSDEIEENKSEKSPTYDESFTKSIENFECGCNDDNIETLSTSIEESLSVELKLYIKQKSYEWNNYSKELIDTHCHFDMLFQRINYTKSIDQYFIDFKDYYIENFKSCITVICDPSKYDTRISFDTILNSLDNPKVYATIGCHPHFANKWNSKIENNVYSSLSHKKIVAIGECGIDVSKKNKVPIDQQEKVFLAQLKIARETEMPIVIHCRDAENSVFDILSEQLDEYHRIHLHCFTGGWDIGKKFLDKFPNLCIGVTPLLTFYSATTTHELINNIPIDRLLFETDAPYFIPQGRFPKTNINFSHPGFVFTVVECVSRIKNISIERLIQINRKNVKKVYGF